MTLGHPFSASSVALAPLALALTLCGCEGCNGEQSMASVTSTRVSATTPSPVIVNSASSAPPKPCRVGAPPPVDQVAKLGEINWTPSINWISYEQALAAAKQSGKRIFLLVYTDWCPQCRAVSQVLEREDVRALLSQLIAVRHDQDEGASWLNQLDGNLDYVPRIMLLNADGTLQRRLVSGHARYPFFYPADRPDALLGALQGALSL